MQLEIEEPSAHPKGASHDRLSVMRDAHGTLIALADGLDPGAASQAAAAMAVRELARCFRHGALPDQPRDWEMFLEAIDFTVFKDPVASETSALVMLIRQGVIVGASVGHSLAYLVDQAGDHTVLTPSHRPGPPIGTALARPIGFGPVPFEGRLITRPAPKLDAVAKVPAFVAA